MVPESHNRDRPRDVFLKWPRSVGGRAPTPPRSRLGATDHSGESPWLSAPLLAPSRNARQPSGVRRGQAAGVLAVTDGSATGGEGGDLDAITLPPGVRRLLEGAYELRGHDASSLLLWSARLMSCALASGANAADRWSKARV